MQGKFCLLLLSCKLSRDDYVYDLIIWIVISGSTHTVSQNDHGLYFPWSIYIHKIKISLYFNMFLVWSNSEILGHTKFGRVPRLRYSLRLMRNAEYGNLDFFSCTRSWLLSIKMIFMTKVITLSYIPMYHSKLVYSWCNSTTD